MKKRNIRNWEYQITMEVLNNLYLSEEFVKKGHEVYVYNSHNHPSKSEWNGVKIFIKDPKYYWNKLVNLFTI